MNESRDLKARRALALLAALLCAGCATTSSAKAASPLSWSSAKAVDPGQAPSAIACPSEHLCVAVDRGGNVLLTLDPAAGTPSWSKPAPIDPGHALTALGCPSEGLCVAVDESGSELASTDPAGGAGTWRAPRSIDGGALTGVSCASTSLCVAVAGDGDALVSTDPGDRGSSWTATHIDGAGGLRGVSCPSATLCLAVDDAGNALASDDPASGGWRTRPIDLAGEPVAVSCGSLSLCVAIDGAGTALTSADAGARDPTWSSTTIDLSGAPGAVSCAGSGLCVLLDDHGEALASDDPTAPVPLWSGSAAEPGNALAGVWCLPSGLCAAVDRAGAALTALVPAPGASATAPVDVAGTEAALTGVVDPNDAALGECRFEYGPTASYGQSAPCAEAPLPTGGAQAVQARVSGLAAGSAYHFRVLARNAGGTGASVDESFSTLAPVTTSIVHPRPSIAGVPGVGERLHCLPGVSAEQAQTVTLRYAWVRDTRAIAKADGASYKVGAADAKHHLQCRVSATDGAGTATATSAFVAIPATGVIAAVGETGVGPIEATGTRIDVPVRCSARAPRGCALALRATVEGSRPGGRSRRTTIVLASATAHLRPGQPETIVLRLNAAGRRMLARERRLALTVTVRGTVIGILEATLATAKVSLPSPNRAGAAGASGAAGKANPAVVATGASSPAGRSAPPAGRHDASAVVAARASVPSELALAGTPYMGWDTYFAFGPRYSEATVLEQTSLLLSSGLARDGYRYVWLDVGWWHGARARDGAIVVDRDQWPHGIRWLAETLHGAGLRVGLYTDAGREGCGGKRAGSYGHYRQDVDTFAAWGFDAVKVDFCGGVRQRLSPRAAYSSFESAIEHDSPRRPMLLSICDFLEPGQYGGRPGFAGSAFSSYRFGPSVGNSWRTDTDVGSPGYVPFESVLRNMDADATQPQAAGPGHWNDPDYLGPDQGMSESQFRTQLSMWAMLAAPLMVSADLTKVSNESEQALADRDLIAVDQDPAGVQGTLLSSAGPSQVWVKPLSDGSRAVALLNRSSSALTISTTAAAIGMAPASSYSVRDLWTRRTTTTTGAIEELVPGESTALLRVAAG
ncbi:MAG TPA: hypothetical protein VMG80_07905 [Solirubrobacteraceae bacterium]|nr:hypothetical protein [Solirubrobacteraceae bacterium]